MKSLVTALGLAFAFATVAPAVSSLPFAAAPAFASKGRDHSADAGRQGGRSDAGHHSGSSDVSSHDGNNADGSHDGQNGIDASNDSGR